MQIEALKVFCDVARCRSFSQAAQENGLSQSAASQIVLQLEKRLSVKLICRSPRPLQLTPLGRTYYDGCKHLLEQYSELEASIRNAQTQMEGSVQVAAIYSVGLGDMGEYVEHFAQQQPQARVQVAYLHPDQVYKQVHEGTADFGLVSFPRKSRELIALPWRSEEMVLACYPTHTLARNLAVLPAQLNGEKFVGFARGLAIRRQVDRFLREQRASVDVALEFDSIENIKKAVEVAAGVALLPEPTIRREVAAHTLVALPLIGCSFQRPLGIIYRRQHQPSKTAQKFIELLRQATSPALDTPASRNGAHAGRNGAARSRRKTTNPARE
jgi:DNA-binding transcriptional LysR family regulator